MTNVGTLFFHYSFVRSSEKLLNGNFKPLLLKRNRICKKFPHTLRPLKNSLNNVFQTFLTQSCSLIQLFSAEALNNSKSFIKASTSTNKRRPSNKRKVFNSFIEFPSENWLEIILDTNFSAFANPSQLTGSFDAGKLFERLLDYATKLKRFENRWVLHWTSVNCVRIVLHLPN